jgi:hypothetical protein
MTDDSKRDRGRPPLCEEPSVRLTVLVTPGQRLHLRRVADEHGRRVAEIVREAIDERLDRDAPE